MNYSTQPYSTIDHHVNNVNKFYINIGNITINDNHTDNHISHSISAERTGNINVYSGIESMVNHQTNTYVLNLDNRKIDFVSPYITHSAPRSIGYSPKKSYSQQPTQQEYQSMITSGMLSPRRPQAQFIGTAEQVQPFVEQTFELLTGNSFPDDIVIRICNDDELRKAHSLHGGAWTNGILGFAINRYPYPSLIFIKQNQLDAMMLTIGHELGHVVAQRLGNPIDEEAKAFAFERAFAKTIIDNNIANLQSSFNVDFTPAGNGIHDRAFNFVHKLIKQGKSAISVFRGFARGTISVLN
jgi:hypothetical protein